MLNNLNSNCAVLMFFSKVNQVAINCLRLWYSSFTTIVCNAVVWGESCFVDYIYQISVSEIEKF